MEAETEEREVVTITSKVINYGEVTDIYEREIGRDALNGMVQIFRKIGRLLS